MTEDLISTSLRPTLYETCPISASLRPVPETSDIDNDGVLSAWKEPSLGGIQIASWAECREARVEANVSKLHEFAEVATLRLTELEARCSTVEQANSLRVETFRKEWDVQLHNFNAKLASQQQQLLELHSITCMPDFPQQSKEASPQLCPPQLQLERLESYVETKVMALRSDINDSFAEERNTSIDRMQALGASLTQRVDQNNNRVHDSVCSKIDTLLVEVENRLHDQIRSCQSDIRHWVAKFSSMEDTLTKILPESNVNTSERSEGFSEVAKCDVKGSYDSREVSPSSDDTVVFLDEKAVVTAENSPVRAESILKNVISKLDQQCFDCFGEDLRLHSEQLVSQQNPKSCSTSTTASDPTTRISSSQAQHEFISECRPPSNMMNKHARSTEGSRRSVESFSKTDISPEVKKFREEIVGFLRSDFRAMVSQTVREATSCELPACSVVSQRIREASTPREHSRACSVESRVQQNSSTPTVTPRSSFVSTPMTPQGRFRGSAVSSGSPEASLAVDRVKLYPQHTSPRANIKPRSAASASPPRRIIQLTAPQRIQMSCRTSTGSVPAPPKLVPIHTDLSISCEVPAGAAFTSRAAHLAPGAMPSSALHAKS
jgi:hypothetical protein